MSRKMTQADCSELIDMGIQIMYSELKRMHAIIASGNELSNADNKALISYMGALNQADKEWRNKIKEAQEDISGFSGDELNEHLEKEVSPSIKKILDIATKN